MSTSSLFEPQGLADLARSFEAQFQAAGIPDVKVYPTRSRKVRIETPVGRLAQYAYTCAAGQCSWSSPKGSIAIDQKQFDILQRFEKGVLLVELTAASPVQRLLTGLTEEPGGEVREIFLTRALRLIKQLKEMDEKKLLQAVSAPTDSSMFTEVLNTLESLAPAGQRDPLAAARLRGMDAKRNMLGMEGGAVSGAEAAQMLKVTRQAIDKRRKEGTLLGVELGKKGYRYPAWQFSVDGVKEVLAALGDKDFWEKLSFFLNPSGLLKDRTPLEVLREGKKNLPQVLRAASTYSEHGA